VRERQGGGERGVAEVEGRGGEGRKRGRIREREWDLVAR
jgi:hypothetical protein